MNRRDFIKTTLLTGTSMIALPFEIKASQGTPVVRSYRALGKTGLKMSDISIGTGKPPHPSLILRAIDRGINYIDTAPDYGKAEEKLAEALKKVKRENVIIASKFCRHGGYPKHLLLGSTKKDYIRMVEGSLRRLGIEYLDVCFVHAMGEVSKNKKEELDRLLNEEMLLAVETLKKEGKIRFLAVSSHGPHNMEELMLEAVKSGHFDIIMTAFNFMKFPRLPEVIKEAYRRGIGVVAMKTLAGAKDMEIKSDEVPFPVAALKWVLSHKEISGLVITMRSVNDLNLYLQASGQKFTSEDARVLKRYASLYSSQYCRTGCNQCETACPEGIPIATTLRYRMYFEDHGMEKEAIVAYNQIGNKALSCKDCRDAECEKSCPHGLNVKKMLLEAHEMLTIA
jgi:hypothetical protein